MSTTSPFFQEWVISPPLEARLLLSGRPFPIRSVHTHYSDTQVKSKTIYLGPRPAGKVKIEARQLSGPSRNYTISWTDFEGKIHPPSGLPIVGLDLGDQDIEDVTPHQIEGMDKAGSRALEVQITDPESAMHRFKWIFDSPPKRTRGARGQGVPDQPQREDVEVYPDVIYTELPSPADLVSEIRARDSRHKDLDATRRYTNQLLDYAIKEKDFEEAQQLLENIYKLIASI